MKSKLFTLVILFAAVQHYAVSQISPNHYLIHFADKNHSEYSINNPEKFLSKRAIERRKKYGIEIVNNDLPVSKFYLDSISALGFKIVNVSKWSNSVCVFTKDSLLINAVSNLSFVSSTGIDKYKSKLDYKVEKASNKPAPPPMAKKDTIESFKKFRKSKDYDYYNKIYGKSLNQIQMHNGHLLHKDGYMGQGMHVAILDGGFYKVNELPAFDSIRANGQILGVKDFVDLDTTVYNESSHGMMVLSTMAGNIPGKLLGTAPKANYWLLRTEDGDSEYVIEEYNWIVAAEFADSVGVDLINSSLGYNTFNDSLTDHTYADLYEASSIISQAAEIAASKGMLLVISGGNSGRGRWRYITPPADANSVLTVGAINRGGKKAGFSSFGLTNAKQIKPDVCAIGVSSILSGRRGSVSAANGTSFASPIMAGVVTCLWQAHPELNNLQIIALLKQYSSQYKNPDNGLGYGIPDAYKAHKNAK